MLDEVAHTPIDSDARSAPTAVFASQQRRERAEALSAVLAEIDGLIDDDEDDDELLPDSFDDVPWVPGNGLAEQYRDDDEGADGESAARPLTQRAVRHARANAAANASDDAAVGTRGPDGDGARWWSTGDERDVERLADSLPFHAPAGYCRDGRGIWRYEATGDRVPGARNRTLATSWRPTRRAHTAALPRNRARASTELQWMFDVEVAHHDPTVVAVSAKTWDVLAARVLGMVAPELSADRLWDVEQVAAYLGVTAGTIWAYRSRDTFPQPVVILGQNPVWSEPLIAAWDSSRPGQGARSDLVSNKRRKSKPARK